MGLNYFKLATAALVGVGLATGAAQAMEPKRGGILNFVTASKIPSFDGHIESTFGVIHPIAPMYSLLIRANPENPSSPTDLVCDVCEGDVPAPSDDGKTYVFKIRKDIKFHDGTPLTAHDVKATYDKIIFPPEGIPSNRKAFFKAVDAVETPDDYTLVFKLKHPTGSFVPALAMPYNFIYAKKDLDAHGYTWHKTNVNGSGPFMFDEYVQGSHVTGKRNPNYHHEGQPFLDGYKSVIAPKMSVRVAAIRGGQADIEFRGFPPKARDDLVAALGDQITVQESDWNCALMVTPNHERKPMDDARVRRALSLAIDRWGGSKYLSKIAIVKTVGGIVFPGHPLAATEAELKQLAGFGDDLKANRAEAKRLLKEAGITNLELEMNNRASDQPYKVVGTWLIDQWKQIGVTVKQSVKPTPQFYATMRQTRDHDISMDFNCQSVVNPILDITKYLPSAGNNYTGWKDDHAEELYGRILRSGQQSEQRTLIREFEKYVLEEKASQIMTLWWYKINPHRSYVKGWKIAPSHYLNQQLDNVWLDK